MFDLKTVAVQTGWIFLKTFATPTKRTILAEFKQTEEVLAANLPNSPRKRRAIFIASQVYYTSVLVG